LRGAVACCSRAVTFAFTLGCGRDGVARPQGSCHAPIRGLGQSLNGKCWSHQRGTAAHSGGLKDLEQHSAPVLTAARSSSSMIRISKWQHLLKAHTGAVSPWPRSFVRQATPRREPDAGKPSGKRQGDVRFAGGESRTRHPEVPPRVAHQPFHLPCRCPCQGALLRKQVRL